MLRNYLKIAFRNLGKYKFISFINLFGLTVGITCCLLILIYIINELSFDKYNSKADRIYRVTRDFKNTSTGAITLDLGTIAPPFGPLLQTDFPEIEKITRLLDNSPSPIKYEEKVFSQDKVFFADENIFDVFDIDVVKGNPAKSLLLPFTVMMTDDLAKKYFGNDDPLDKTLKIFNQFDLRVTGIFKPFPGNSHMHPEMLISFNTLKDTAVYGEERLRTNFGNNAFFTYLLLPQDYNTETMLNAFPAFLDKHIPQRGGNNAFKPSQGTSLGLQKLTDIHLRSHLDDEIEENGDIKRVYVFSAIGLFILLIACINYMNLSTARSAVRAKEIGIRKTVGAERKEIITQFLSESVLVAWMAMIFALILTWLILPALNNLSGQQLRISSLFNPGILVAVLLLPFVVGLISGIYPALFMSSFQPIKVLKGMMKVEGANISFRKVLVTAQFAISIILIISTVIVFKQLDYMQNKSLGYDKNHILTIGYNNVLDGQFESFRNELLANSNIKSVGRSSRIPTTRLLDAMGTRAKNGDSLAPVSIDLKYLSVDENFVNTYGVKVVAGRNFSGDFSTDTSAFVVNEAAVQALDISSANDAIGKDLGYGSRTGKIVGVIQDFHFESLHQKIVPLILLMPRNPDYGSISFKIAGNNIPAAVSDIEKNWKKFVPDTPFDYSFLDENYASLYDSEKKQQAIFVIFSCIAIFIACLGLFGLSAFAITQRIKEIGIRKVLGASIGNIVQLLSRDFLILVVIAAVIAFPIAWYAMHSWLQDFAYRTTMPWWVFILAGILSAIIAFATISFVTVKAAVANPVNNLRSE